MVQVFDFVRDKFASRAPAAAPTPNYRANLPPDDAWEVAETNAVDGVTIGGLLLVLDYVDADGAPSTRRVSCVRIEQYRGWLYLRAFCHERRAPRRFRIERIGGVYDATTGEFLADGTAFFADYVDAAINGGAGHWGLSRSSATDLAAALIVLAFLSRCDGQVHAAEIDEAETFAAGWWIRSETGVPMPEAMLVDHIRRLAPDVEAFELAAHHARSAPMLRKMLAGYARRLIEADGRIAPEEHHWIERLIAWWDEA